MPVIDFHPEAIQELGEARVWYELHAPTVLERFERRFDRLLESITKFPAIGEEDSWKNRCVLLDGFPYAVHYQVRSDCIRVIAFAHTSREPGYWRERI